MIHADSLLKRALDKYFLGETNDGRWHFFHDDQRRFYESEHSKTIRRLKAQKSRLSFMDKQMTLVILSRLLVFLFICEADGIPMEKKKGKNKWIELNK